VLTVFDPAAVIGLAVLIADGVGCASALTLDRVGAPNASLTAGLGLEAFAEKVLLPDGIFNALAEVGGAADATFFEGEGDLDGEGGMDDFLAD
jgi:hypothetical protein